MKIQFCDVCLSLQQVYEWTKKFMNGISSVTDAPRRGQAHRVVTSEGIAAVETIVKENVYLYYFLLFIDYYIYILFLYH